ncbi:unnamed protein product [Mytilus coruscus]|uniref:Uncharacterized protein n=1 Tax=Mytilus coruscus TaxID=42192 RepID=A0A6J8DRU6_MYTCO|nr:unnamed protein product [Mytilus coruscus]
MRFLIPQMSQCYRSDYTTRHANPHSLKCHNVTDQTTRHANPHSLKCHNVTRLYSPCEDPIPIKCQMSQCYRSDYTTPCPSNVECYSFPQMSNVTMLQIRLYHSLKCPCELAMRILIPQMSQSDYYPQIRLYHSPCESLFPQMSQCYRSDYTTRESCHNVTDQNPPFPQNVTMLQIRLYHSPCESLFPQMSQCYRSPFPYSLSQCYRSD